MLAFSPNLAELTQRVHGRWFPKVELLTESREHVRDYREGMLHGAITNFLATLGAGAFTQSGLTAFTAGLVANNTLDNAWHVDSAVAGAWLQVDLGVGVTKAFQWLRIRTGVVAGMPNATWDVEYSDNGTTWSKAYTGLIIGPGGVSNFNWFAIAWPFAGTHRYWRILLTNAPGSGPWYQELAMAESLAFDATGAVRLASNMQQDIAYGAGTAKFSGLLDDLAVNVQRALLFEVDAARNPLTVTKLTARCHRQADGVGALFDGTFMLHTFAVVRNGRAEWNVGGVITATNGWEIAPLCAPVEVLASSVSWSANEAEVDFILPGEGVDTRLLQVGDQRPVGRLHILFVLTIVRGTNANAAWMHDTAQTDGEETTASKGTLSWWNMNRAVFTVYVPGSGMGFGGGAAYLGQQKPSAGGWFRLDKSNSLGRAAIHVRTNTGASAVLAFDVTSLNDADFDLGLAPTGDVEFSGKGETPLGTTLLFEVWNGSAWVIFKDGDRAAIELPTVPKQQTYQMRATLTGSTDNLRTPVLRSVGVRDIQVTDVSRLIEWPDTFYQVTDLVNCRAEVAELRLRIVRHGPAGDAEDVISRLVSETANITAMHVRISMSAPSLARADELHIDTYRVDDYLPSEAGLDLFCVSALDRLKLPIPKRKLVSGNWVVDPAKYDAAAGHHIRDVFTDLRDGQLGLAARYAGSVPQGGPIDRAGIQWNRLQGQVGAPGVGTAGKTELAKDVLEQLARIAGGVLTTIQGKIHYRDLFGAKPVVAVFPERELTWDATPPGLRQRAPRVLISFQPTTLGGKDWTKSIEREDAVILAAIEQAGTEAGTQVDEFPESVSRWIRVSAPTSLTDSTTDDAEGMADAMAHRHVRTFGGGLLLWPFTTRIPHPHIEIGDMVAVENSKFVGRDPILGRELRGTMWARAVVVGRNLWGTRFLVWIRSFTDMTTSSRAVSQRGTFEPIVTAVVEDVDGRPDQARVRVRSHPDTSEVTIRYKVLDDIAAVPERSTDATVWTTYTGPVVITRDASRVQRFVAWGDWLGAWGPRVILEIAPDRRPQILSMTISNAHVDIAHQDVAHQDVAHGDTAHSDSHTDSAHQDTHGDSHGDQPVLYWVDGQCIGDTGTDVCQEHDDHNDFIHSDTAHGDTHGDAAHTDAAHSDAHTDAAHGDGNYGVGVTVQADGDTGSIKVVARKIGGQLVRDPGFENDPDATSPPTGWSENVLNIVVNANVDVHSGAKRAIINTLPASPNDGHVLYQVNGAGIPGAAVRVVLWVKAASAATWANNTSSDSTIFLQEAGGGFRALTNTIGGSIPTSWTRLEMTGTMPADVVANIRLILRGGRNGATPVDVYVDDVTIEVDSPSPLDVRNQPAIDGRNVTTSLIDVVTGGQIVLNPGDTAYIGGLPFSRAAAAGVEGPLALARASRFTVAPVGVDQWVPG